LRLERDTLVPEGLAPAIGFSHGIATRGGRIVWLAGQNGTDAEGRITAVGDLVAQTDQALANLIAVVEAAGGTAGDIVKLHLWVRDVAAYREGRRALGHVWRKHFGRYYPAMMLLGVSGFYDDEAEIEIDGYAVVADDTAEDPQADPAIDPATPDADGTFTAGTDAT
jgi:enamine deaminase RidA (YjgF/YER057c/UK114 family)